PVAVLPTQHRLARAASVSLTDLEREPLILEECPAVSEYVMGLFDAVGIKPNIAARLKSFEVIRSFVGRGRGYAIHIVNPLVTTTYDGQKLAVKPLSDELPPAQIASVTLGLQNLRPAVKIFADFLQTALASKRSHSDEAASAAASPA
ncbi:MAG TPA: LysR substrate-binding domain-containing protein, partial [Hyphomicrobiales bacterium]|nr:LysR substrate-binding domain-containing protein [Hyphomicrobiales bacterium]